VDAPVSPADPLDAAFAESIHESANDRANRAGVVEADVERGGESGGSVPVVTFEVKHVLEISARIRRIGDTALARK
jgi:hypothetical protein